jgi:beta-lactamase class A
VSVAEVSEEGMNVISHFSRTAWAAAGLLLCLAPAFDAEIQGLRKIVRSEIKASGAKVSLAFKDLETGNTLFIRQSRLVHAASTMKVAVMIEVFRQAAAGAFTLDDRLAVRNEFRSIVDGSPFSLRKEDDSDPEIYDLIGQKLSIRDLVERMITVSSNLATNMLIDLVHARSVTTTLRRLGMRRMIVLRGVEDNAAYARGLNNRTSALDLMRVMEAIAAGRAGSPADCLEMISILGRQRFRDGIPAGLPEGVAVANKTGAFAGVDHDAAIIFPPGRKPCLLVVLTWGWKPGREGKELIARLAGLIYRAAIPAS